MTKHSVHIAVNTVDTSAYPERFKPLLGCIKDAEAMAALAITEGFVPTPLHGPGATADAVLRGLERQATILQPGDLLLVSYSGHGSFRPDREADEEDGYDETWVLYDRQLLDDELWFAWSKFRPGVRVFVSCDSCHSGTVIRQPALAAVLERVPPVLDGPERLRRSRRLPRDARHRDFEARQGLYQEVAGRTPSRDDVKVEATVLLFAACHDDEDAREDDDGGVFTKALLDAWKTETIRDYREFFNAIVKRVSGQSPNLLPLGREDPAFERQRPFTA